MTKQSGLQGGKQRHVLLAQGGQVATNASKGLCASERAETARNLLLDLDHAQIPLGLIVVKRDTQVSQESPDGLLVFCASDQADCARDFV
jgi:hypothetical protein